MSNKTGTTRKQRYLAAGVFVALTIVPIVGWLWWTAREFELPGEHWMTKAFAEARTWADDAELSAIEGRYVKPDGVAELQPSGGQGWRFVFRSRARATATARPAAGSVVPGAPAPARAATLDCFEYSVTRGSGRQRNLVRTSGRPVWCGNRLGESRTGTRDPPRCSLRQVWQHAKQLGAPDPGYAEITASVDGEAWRWHFRIEGHIEIDVPDDC